MSTQFATKRAALVSDGKQKITNASGAEGDFVVDGFTLGRGRTFSVEDADRTLTADEIINAYIYQDPTAARNLTLPSAESVVQLLTSEVLTSPQTVDWLAAPATIKAPYFDFYVYNGDAANATDVISPAPGWVDKAIGLKTVLNRVQGFRAIIVNKTPGSETILLCPL